MIYTFKNMQLELVHKSHLGVMPFDRTIIYSTCVADAIYRCAGPYNSRTEEVYAET